MDLPPDAVEGDRLQRHALDLEDQDGLVAVGGQRGRAVPRSPLAPAGTGVSARTQLPMVGVPDPIAIEKTCSAVIPLPAPALTVGSVTEATVLPAASGTDAK